MIVEKQIDKNKFPLQSNSGEKINKQRDNNADLLEKFYKSYNIIKWKNEKMFNSMIQTPCCGLCHRLIETSQDFNSSLYCDGCSRFFHLNCAKEFKKKICQLCEYKYLKK